MRGLEVRPAGFRTSFLYRAQKRPSWLMPFKKKKKKETSEQKFDMACAYRYPGNFLHFFQMTPLEVFLCKTRRNQLTVRSQVKGDCWVPRGHALPFLEFIHPLVHLKVVRALCQYKISNTVSNLWDKCYSYCHQILSKLLLLRES